MHILHLADINHTFNLRPDLQKVYVLPNGDHYFDLDHAKQALPKGAEITALARNAKELQPRKSPKA